MCQKNQLLSMRLKYLICEHQKAPFVFLNLTQTILMVLFWLVHLIQRFEHTTQYPQRKRRPTLAMASVYLHSLATIRHKQLCQDLGIKTSKVALFLFIVS